MKLLAIEEDGTEITIICPDAIRHEQDLTEELIKHINEKRQHPHSHLSWCWKDYTTSPRIQNTEQFVEAALQHINQNKEK